MCRRSVRQVRQSESGRRTLREAEHRLAAPRTHGPRPVQARLRVVVVHGRDGRARVLDLRARRERGSSACQSRDKDLPPRARTGPRESAATHLDPAIAGKDGRVGRDRAVAEDLVRAVLPDDDGLDAVRVGRVGVPGELGLLKVAVLGEREAVARHVRVRERVVLRGEARRRSASERAPEREGGEEGAHMGRRRSARVRARSAHPY